MEEERKIGLNLFSDVINKTLGVKIENELFNYSENNKIIYMNKLKYLFELLHPESKLYNTNLIKNIKSEKISVYDLINLKPWDLCKDIWKDIIEEQNKTDKIVMDKTPIYTTDQFVCSKCKNNKCKTYSLQTRSADEPTTIFVNCIKCDNTWRMS
tara:strand:- start:824 stop:1288 length:465 start_codon:yes stop_codon:yes gene_type:complete